jgi:hypothetical protein
MLWQKQQNSSPKKECFQQILVILAMEHETARLYFNLPFWTKPVAAFNGMTSSLGRSVDFTSIMECLARNQKRKSIFCERDGNLGRDTWHFAS